MIMTTTKPRLLISLCSLLLLASSVVVHGRYFGGPDSAQQLLQDQDLFDIDGSLPNGGNGNGNVPISALEGSLDQPAIVDDEVSLRRF